jgi:hypothetical protein
MEYAAHVDHRREAGTSDEPRLLGVERGRRGRITRASFRGGSGLTNFLAFQRLIAGDRSAAPALSIAAARQLLDE